jgi:hypothetical protein
MSTTRNIWNTLGYVIGAACIALALALVLIGCDSEGSLTGVVGVLLILYVDTTEKRKQERAGS